MSSAPNPYVTGARAEREEGHGGRGPQGLTGGPAAERRSRDSTKSIPHRRAKRDISRLQSLRVSKTGPGLRICILAMPPPF